MLSALLCTVLISLHNMYNSLLVIWEPGVTTIFSIIAIKISLMQYVIITCIFDDL